MKFSDCPDISQLPKVLNPGSLKTCIYHVFYQLSRFVLLVVKENFG